MKGPLLELADIITAAGHRFIDRPPAWFTWMHLKVLVAIERCRTAAMGGIWISAPAAAIAPSPITLAATGTARSAKARRATAG